MSVQVLGIIEASWKGRKIDCQKGSSFSAGGVINTPLVAGRRLFHAQEWKEGAVEVMTLFRASDTLSSIYDPTPGELQIKCDTGQQFVWASAVQTGERPKITDGEGKYTMKWSVDEPQELVS